MPVPLLLLGLIPILTKYAPDFINLLVGPKAGRVAEAAGKVLRELTGSADPVVAEPILEASPELASQVRLRLAEIAAEERKAEREAELNALKLEMANTASARDQTVALARAGSIIAWAAPIVSVIAVLGFFLSPVVGRWLGINYPDIWLGAMIAAFTGVFNYWLGASASGRRSQEALVAQTQTTSETASAMMHVVRQSPPSVAPIVVPPPAVASQPSPSPAVKWQRFAPDGLGWRTTSDGIVTETDSEPLRTVGEPVTVANIWTKFGSLIGPLSAKFGVPATVVTAIIATESRGDPDAYRKEPDGRESSGLGQALTSTAAEIMGRPVSVADLRDPALAIEVTCRYLQRQAVKTSLDPILASAGYNAGGLYFSNANRWRLRSTDGHLDRSARYFGDACFVSIRDNWHGHLV